MKLSFILCFALIYCMMIDMTYTMPADKKNPNTCNAIQCPFNYDPICAKPQSGKGADLSFGSKCVLDKYNCEHSSEPYVEKSKGECPGSKSVRLQ